LLPSCSNLPEADSAIQQLFELALGTLRQAGATLVEDFVIQGNSYGQDWDAARGGQGPAIGEASTAAGCFEGPQAAFEELPSQPACRSACCIGGAGATPPLVGARRCPAAPTLTALALPIHSAAAGHWNVNGRWEDLWACQSPFRDGLDAYLAAGNTSRAQHSLADIYRQGGPGGQGRGGAGRGGAGRGQGCVASITASGRLLILDTRTACVLCGPGCLPSRSGAFHPEVEDEILAALRATFSPEGYPTPAMRAAGMLCGCSYGWTDPCRSEFKQASGSCLPGINT
jgi:hypothetical protein